MAVSWFFSKLAGVTCDIFESLIRNISGPLGRKLRYFYYKKRFARCGKNVIIDIGVVIEGAGYIELGDNVWINQYTQLVAGEAANLDVRIMKKIINPRYTRSVGRLYIESGVGIGAFNILHAFGGLLIEKNVTTSAGVKIYSFSHYYRDDANPGKVTYANCMASPPEISCITSPIIIGEGAWIGINATVFAGYIGSYSFVGANSVVTGDLPANSYAMGQPAVRLRDRFDNYSSSNG